MEVETKFPQPEVGDTLILISHGKIGMRGYAKMRYHGLEAEVVKVTPTGMLDLRFHPRDRGKPTTERTDPWTGEKAYQKTLKHHSVSWSAVPRQHPEAVGAKEEGEAAYAADQQEKQERKDAQRRAFLAPDADFHLNLKRREIETIIERLDPEQDSDVILYLRDAITPEDE